METLQPFLKANPDVKFIRFQVMSQVSIVHSRIFPVKRALEIAAKGFVKGPISPFVNSTTLASTLVRPSLLREVAIWEPDWDSLRICCYHPSHAAVMCFNRQIGEHPRDGYALCPRHQLKRQLEKAKMDFLVGWEIELQIMDKDKTTTIPNHSGMMSTSAYRNKFFPVMEEIALALEENDIEVYSWHGEEPFEGFFEMALMPLPAMEAADAFVYCHETIKGIASNHEMVATMHPKPFQNGGPQIGSHIHLSISKPEVEETFLAGLLDTMPALTALMAPLIESFERMKKHQWLTWGNEDKGTLVRICGPGHWEIRRPDGAMNPYLVLAGIIIAGTAGVQEKKKVTSLPLSTSTYEFSEEEREKDNITTRMPGTLHESLILLEEDKLLGSEDAFGLDFVKGYLRLKRQEEDHMGAKSAEERRARCLPIF